MVTFAVRSTDVGERTATGIRKAAGNDALHVGPFDLADRALIAAFTSARSGSPPERLFSPLPLGRPDPLTGSDHLALQLITAEGGETPPLTQWRRLAGVSAKSA
ncbi:hypothetical protein ACWGDT_12220 [Streptomyces avermitilis]